MTISSTRGRPGEEPAPIFGSLAFFTDHRVADLARAAADRDMVIAGSTATKGQ